MARPAARFGYLDSLRLLAAVLVVGQHVFEGHGGWVDRVLIPLGPGVAGVALFFFISGYVIPLSVATPFAPLPFMVRRCFRIYPLYLAALALLFVTAATGLVGHWQFMLAAPPGDWLANLALVQEFAGARAFLGVSWTLIIELIWYGLFAAALLRFGPRAGDMLDRFVPLALVALTLLSLAIGTRIPLGRPMMIYAAVLGFQCLRRHRGELSDRQLARSFGVFAVTVLAASYVGFGVFRHPTITLAQAMGPWTLATLLFAAAVLVRPLREAAVVNAGVLPVLGAASYSIYLLHPFAIAVATEHAGSGYLPVALGLTALLALIGYRGIERPGIALGRGVAARFAVPAAEAAR